MINPVKSAPGELKLFSAVSPGQSSADFHSTITTANAICV